jgi:hypothetical protein
MTKRLASRISRVGRLMPREWRLRVSGLRATALSWRTKARLARLADRGRPIVAGPWFGEVGFELLYWIPFLAWFTDEFNVNPDRIVAVSRGGAGSWYGGLAATYCDVFDLLDAGEYRRRNHARIESLGEQKQIEVTSFDAEVTTLVQRRLGISADVLHPSLMYALFAPFWWGHLSIDWIDAHTRFRRLTRPSVPTALALPREYAAVKFYFNDCFRDGAETRAFAHETTRELARGGAVVALSTGLKLDDHGSCDVDGVTVAQPGYEARTNLDVQTAIVSRARRFVGTYGGFAYLPPFFGVPATAYFSDATAYSRRHLEVAHFAIERMGGGHLLDVRACASAPIEHSASSIPIAHSALSIEH